MPSALALQLAASTSLNASLLQKKRRTESYLFTGRDADVHDLDSIHALASSAFSHLCSLSPTFSSQSVKSGADGASLAVNFEQSLFSDAAKAIDRTLQTPDLNAHLDRNITAFLAQLGPWLMEPPASKVLEWLVRRFRVHEFNVSALLALFLPYHESPHFIKMLSILHIQQNSSFSFLIPFKSAAKSLARSALIKAMVSDLDVARFVTALFPDAVKCSHSHRTLLAFHTATMHDYISSLKSLDDSILAFIFPSLLTPLQPSQKDTNVTLGCFVLLCTLSRKVNLKPAAMSAIIGAMTAQVRGVRGSGKGSISTSHFVKTAVAICSSQEIMQDFPLHACLLCIKMSGFVDEVSKNMAVIGIQHFIVPLVRTLSVRIYEHRVSSLFSTLINTSNVPSMITGELSRILVQLATLPREADLEGAEAEIREKTISTARSLLSLVHQRHYEFLNDVADDVLCSDGGRADESKEERKERKKVANELLASFSLTHALAESSDIGEIVVASAGRSKETRVSAVERIYSTLKTRQNTLTATDMASIQSALFSRVYDTHVGVLQALYASPDLFLSTIATTTSPRQLLDAIASQLHPKPPARVVLRAHIAFLAGPFIKAHPDVTHEVQQTALFQFLFASRVKFKMTCSVWHAIGEGTGFQKGWLRGCNTLWDYLPRKEVPANTDEVNEKMCQFNLVMADKIAENILDASSSTEDIAVLLSKLHDPASQARALAYLVCHSLLKQTSGDQQILLARRIVSAMRPISLGAIDISDVKEALDVDGIASMAVIKLGSRQTIRALQASILALVPTIPVPSMCSSALVVPLADQTSSDPNQNYVSLMQETYALATASASAGSVPDSFSTSLLQSLFHSLKDTSLAFLLGSLLSFSPSMEKVRTHALLHILAFIRGHIFAGISDFQSVLPSLIALLLDSRSDQQERFLVLESISLIHGNSNKKHIYGLDTLYGSASSQLQYMYIKDVSTYVKALMDDREQLIQDPDHIQTLHQQHLMGSSAKYRSRVLCFLLSHITSHPYPSVRISLLRSLESVTDSAKSHMLLPIMKVLMQDSASVAHTFGPSAEVYISLVVEDFLKVSPAILARRDDESWPVFLSGLRLYFQSSAFELLAFWWCIDQEPTDADAHMRQLFVDFLEQGLFARLDLDRRSEVCNILLLAGSEGGELYMASRTLLGKLLNKDVTLIVHLLAQFQPDNVENEAPVNKRVKLDTTSHTLEAIKLQPLSALAEVLGTTEMPGSLELLANLLETLNKIIRSDLWGPSDTNYVCQMLMAAMDKCVGQITQLPGPSRPIRLDVLVELIRVTDNPQTFNEALLLIAKLTRLTPHSVLHYIMPIFTFMGSNVFHRDDSYSFKVVESTINSIVPVMVSSMKPKRAGDFYFYVKARDFLRVFTDASNHVPRHRRQKFFVHLTEVLGAQIFLPPVCMLLIDKVANRASRQTLEEAQNTFALPTSLLRHFDRSLQVFVLTEVLKECLRLRAQLLSLEHAGPSFLDYPRDGEHSLSASATLKRRIQALILFVSTSLTPSEDDTTSEGDNTPSIIARLLDLATLPRDHASESDSVAIVTAAQTAIERIMNVISAREFLAAGRVMLTSDDARIKTAALEVLCSRIPLVTEKMREECQAMVIDLIDLIRGIIERQSAGSLVESALAALKVLGSTCCSGEETALLSTLSHVLKVVQSRTSAAVAASVLPCYVTALGPRIIPHFRDISQECMSILREGLKGKTSLADAREAALATMHSLLLSLPAFYGTKELTEIAKLYVDYNAVSTLQNNPLTGLSKAISKRTSAEVLLPVLHDLWPTIDKAQTKDDVNGMIGYFVLLKRALHAAPCPEVLDNTRTMFKVFMEAFDVKMAFGFTEGEPYVISAFIELVIKLNENAFRPLFRRMHDWAFVDDKATDERRVTFCHVYAVLLDYFKGLMNPYLSTLLHPLTEVLQSFTSSSKIGPTNLTLWSGVIVLLTKSLEADDGVFWREDKIATLLPHLLSQVPIAVQLPSPSSVVTASSESEPKTLRQLLVSCILSVIALLPNTCSDLLKRLNLDLLMHTRSEDARVRILALECATEMWKAEGINLVGFVGETATFIAECAEDDNDSVVREAQNLKNAVESVAGNISGL